MNKLSQVFSIDVSALIDSTVELLLYVLGFFEHLHFYLLVKQNLK